MNTNRIRLEGFSNPDTERHFREHWTGARQVKEMKDEKCCGFCRWTGFLTREGAVLCVNPDCPYCYEKVSLTFSCHQQRTLWEPSAP